MPQFLKTPQAWEKLEPNQQSLVCAVMLSEIQSIGEGQEPKDAYRLFRISCKRLNRVGIISLKPCIRCGGTGKMPFNVFAGQCFKCQGTKFLYPKITNKLLKDITEKLNGQEIPYEAKKSI